MNADNICIFRGALGRDSELKHLPSGAALLKFSIAVNKSFKDKDGNWNKKTTWINCQAWQKLADNHSGLKKGDLVQVTGELLEDSYEKDGVKKTYYNLNCDSIAWIRPKGQQSQNNPLDIFEGHGEIQSNANFTADDIPF